MARPKSKVKAVVTSVRLLAVTVVELDARARLERRSRSQMVQMAIEEMLKRAKDKR